jgi:hypothetical protein
MISFVTLKHLDDALVTECETEEADRLLVKRVWCEILRFLKMSPQTYIHDFTGKFSQGERKRDFAMGSVKCVCPGIW